MKLERRTWINQHSNFILNHSSAALSYPHLLTKVFRYYQILSYPIISLVMIKKYLSIIAAVLISCLSFGQFPGMGGPGGARGGMNRDQMNVGRFYGKIIDSKSGKGIEFATVQLMGSKFDSTSKSMKPTIMGGQITPANGDFSIEKLPPFGEYTLQINAIGYKPVEQKIKFDLKFELGKQMDMQKAMNAVDKDLGNIKIESTTNLKEVVIDGTEPSFKLDIDKKVFNVDKNQVTAGGTAEDVLKTIPSVSVDIDGNVALRNSAPQLFVDGRPSSMTIQQIPADAIQSVELITNPSAKYDASGGMGGIINIVLKKNRKLGYNGGIRAGVDKFGKLNLGGDVNLREGKVNVFGMLFFNQRKTISTGYTDRTNRVGSPLTNVHQDNESTQNSSFTFGRFGLDYFPDNRNTFTIGMNIGGGGFSPEEKVKIRTDSVESNTTTNSIRLSDSKRSFNNLGSNLSYKHLFPKAGNELTADINFNRSKNDFNGDFSTAYFDSDNNQFLPTIFQKQSGKGSNNFVTVQTDYVNPLTENSKIEGGLRYAYTDNSSINENFIQNPFTREYIQQFAISNNYKFNSQVYAAYSTFSQKINKFSFQTGLRVESSKYVGTLILRDSTSTFSNKFPFSVFPSLFVTYRVNDKDDIQFSYTRKVNRPNFFQIIPFVDYTDSLNLSKGNPDLVPEFTNSLELSYLRTINSKSTFLTSFYYKNTNGLITRYQDTVYNPILGRTVILSSYINANRSYSYGGEATFKSELYKWLDLTANINVFNAVIDGTNIDRNLKIERLAWFGKLNVTFKLPKNWSIQVNSEYRSRTAVPASGGSRGGGQGGGGFGGGFFGGGSTSSAQGYIREYYSMDLSVKKDLFKNKMGSISASFNDVFRSNINFNHSESEFFVQDTFRRRNPQYIRINFSYRFGKFDVSLFKRKNLNNMDGGGMEIGGAQ